MAKRRDPYSTAYLVETRVKGGCGKWSVTDMEWFDSFRSAQQRAQSNEAEAGGFLEYRAVLYARVKPKQRTRRLPQQSKERQRWRIAKGAPHRALGPGGKSVWFSDWFSERGADGDHEACAAFVARENARLDAEEDHD